MSMSESEIVLARRRGIARWIANMDFLNPYALAAAMTSEEARSILSRPVVPTLPPSVPDVSSEQRSRV